MCWDSQPETQGLPASVVGSSCTHNESLVSSTNLEGGYIRNGEGEERGGEWDGR